LACHLQVPPLLPVCPGIFALISFLILIMTTPCNTVIINDTIIMPAALSPTKTTTVQASPADYQAYKRSDNPCNFL
ncbi:MAG: hypothetical protein MJ097_05760, partial [Dorea sp.]|nr:hypothetical protein [Dorea sp.]